MNAETLLNLSKSPRYRNNFQRESVSSSIVNLIIDYLATKKLKPGDKIPTEQEFVAYLGVGRNSVREAIKMLSIMGVVEIKKGIGSFIAETIPSSSLNPLVLSLAMEQGLSLDLIELRILIDTGVCSLVIDKVDEEGIKLLEATNDLIGSSITTISQGSISLEELDYAFHETLFRLANNPLIEKIGMAVYKLFNVSMKESMKANPKQAYENHKLILDAIKERDKSKLEKVIRDSLSIWSEFV